jgi:hypothetical protein
LELAAGDAKALAAALKWAGAGQYAEVKVTEALDSNATAAGLQQIVAQLWSKLQQAPRSDVPGALSFKYSAASPVHL